jgi:hypothetical protein
MYETPDLDSVEVISRDIAVAFIEAHHYSRVMPRITKHILGGIKGGQLVAVATLGFGTRPVHTIKKIFPSLGSADYLELGKLCLLDEMPRNSESYFIAKVLGWVRKNVPTCRVFYSWADALLNKPGFIYQASNFFFGGHIKTEMYVDAQGNKFHARSVQGHPDLPQSTGKFKTRSFEAVSKIGLTKYYGYQFRYCYPLCGNKEWKRLLAESTVTWTRGNYPKSADCRWWKQTRKGHTEECPFPFVVATKQVAK